MNNKISVSVLGAGNYRKEFSLQSVKGRNSCVIILLYFWDRRCCVCEMRSLCNTAADFWCQARGRILRSRSFSSRSRNNKR